MGAKIEKISYYLPENILDNLKLTLEYPDWTADKIESKTGIRERHVVDGETALDLALRSAESVLQDYDRTNIDYIILCTQSPEYYLPTSACILQDRLGLRQNVGAFDFNLGCSGYVYGLAIAKALVNSRMSNAVLLITSETYTRYIHPLDRGNRTIFGDGAAASIIGFAQDESIGEFVLGTDGSGFENLIVPNGGARNRYDKDAVIVDDGSGSIRTANNLYMNGPEIFNFTIRVVPGLVRDILEKNKLALDDIDYVICHQANKFMLDYLRKKIKIPEEKFYINMLHTGNTVSSTIPIAINNALSEGIIKSGDRILLAGFGVGYSWGGTIITL